MLVLLAILAGGCGQHREDPGRATSRSDSAGVEIVVVSPSPDDGPILDDLATADVLRLGSPGASPESQFGAVRDVVPLPDGGVAVLDEQAAEIRVFSADGAYRSTLGQRGDGPGELREPVDLELLGDDTLAVYDRAHQRVTRFGIDGGRARTVPLEDVGSPVSEARLLSDGRLVGQSHLSSSGGEAIPNGDPVLVRNLVALRLFDEAGSVVSAIDTVPSLEEIVRIRIGGGSVSVMKRPPAFGRDNLFAPGPAGTWSSENDRFELRLRDSASGRLMRIVRAPSFDAVPTDGMLDDIRREATAASSSDDERQEAEEWATLSPRPELQPAFDALTTDQRGRVWVRRWSPVGTRTRWWIFEPTGDLLGALDTPGPLTITTVTCDAIAGFERDELGVTYAVRYRTTATWLCE